MVVDASVAFKWFVEEPGTEAARKLIADGVPLKAPGHLLLELLNAFWLASLQGRFDPKLARTALEKVERLVDLVPVELLTETAMEMALALRHPIYDCLYLAAAADMSSIVITADDRFLRIAGASKWAANVSKLQTV